MCGRPTKNHFTNQEQSVKKSVKKSVNNVMIQEKNEKNVEGVSESLPSSARFNYKGTALLTSCGTSSPGAAIREFQKALTILRRLKKMVLPQSSSSLSLTELQQIQEDASLEMSSQFQREMQSSKRTAKIPNFSDERFFLYSSALTFDTGQEDFCYENNDTTETCKSSTSLRNHHHNHLIQLGLLGELDFYISIVLFNMGLSYHKWGMDSTTSLVSTRQQAYFSRALSYYEQSLRSLNAIPTNYTKDTLILMLAIRNNQSQIHYELGEYQKYNRKLEHLRSMVKTFDQKRRGGPNEGLTKVDKLHISEMVLNLVAIKPPVAAPSA